MAIQTKKSSYLLDFFPSYSAQVNCHLFRPSDEHKAEAIQENQSAQCDRFDSRPPSQCPDPGKVDFTQCPGPGREFTNQCPGPGRIGSSQCPGPGITGLSQCSGP